MINKNTAFNILLISAVIFFVISYTSQNRNNETIRNEWIHQVSKQLKRQKIETEKRINDIETKIKNIKHNDTINLKRIETTENNYKNILRNIKTIDNEKTTKDLEIYNADSSSDWDWFIGRFPKSKDNYGLSVETDTIFRKPSQNGQHKSY